MPSCLNAADWNSEAKIRSFLPLKIGDMADRVLRNHFRGFGERHGDAMQTFVGAKPEVEFPHCLVAGDFLPLRDGGDEAWCRQHLKAFIDADKKLRRNDRALDGAELRAFDLARDRAKLARRVEFDFDPAAGVLLDVGTQCLAIQIERRIESRRR